MATLTHIASNEEPKLGNDVVMRLNKWDGRQLFLLSNERIWITVELTESDKKSLLKMLPKDWLQ